MKISIKKIIAAKLILMSARIFASTQQLPNVDFKTLFQLKSCELSWQQSISFALCCNTQKLTTLWQELPRKQDMLEIHTELIPIFDSMNKHAKHLLPKSKMELKAIQNDTEFLFFSTHRCIKAGIDVSAVWKLAEKFS